MPTSYQICLLSPFLTMISAERAHPSICSPKLALRASDKKNSDKWQPWTATYVTGWATAKAMKNNRKYNSKTKRDIASSSIRETRCFEIQTGHILCSSPFKRATGGIALCSLKSWFVFTFSKFIWFLMTVLKRGRTYAKPSVCIFILTKRGTSISFPKSCVFIHPARVVAHENPVNDFKKPLLAVNLHQCRLLKWIVTNP